MLDIQMKRPEDPEYDPKTIFISQKEYDRLSPFMRQYWSMKMHNWDKVLLFQKGKFYELYYIDAIIGHYFLKIGWSWSPQQPNSGEVSSRYDSGPTFSNPLSVGIHENVLNKHCQELIDLGF